MAPHGGIDTAQCSEKARRDLLQLLEGVRGKKNLVIERSLADLIGLFVRFSTLQEYGVDKVFYLENNNVDSSQRNVVFLARSEDAIRVQAIAEQIKRLRNNASVNHEFAILWVPRRTLVSNQILEEAGVLGDISALEMPLYFLGLETDLLSLELEDSFSDLYLRKDPGCMFTAAKALMLIQQQYGLFPRIIGKGDNAKRLADLLIRMRSELKASESPVDDDGLRGLLPSALIESLIIIDREVDFSTVLLTQLTYEGLIDEVFAIKCNQSKIDTSIVGAASNQQQQAQDNGGSTSMKRPIQLDSSDKLYAQIRDTNFAIVGSILNKVARRLQTDYESRHAKSTVTDLRDFVNKLPGYQAEQQSLKIHTGLAEEILNYTRSDVFSRILEVQQNLAAGTEPSLQHDNIEELINRAVPLPTILRLLCLESCVAGGLRPKDHENFKKLILQAYGYQHILTLSALEKLGLLQSRSSAGALLIPTVGGGPPGAKTNYNMLRKTLHLIVDEVNESEPDDIAYVFSGYAPLSIRLVQCILQKQTLSTLLNPRGGQSSLPPNATGWRGFEDTLRQVRGESFDLTQSGDDKAAKARQTLSGPSGERTVVVFFLGGVTFAEIAALRFIGQQLAPGKRLVIGTTSMINGNKVVATALEQQGFGES